MTGTYPELQMIHELVDQVNAVIDGEIVAFDADGQELVRGPAAADEPARTSGRSRASRSTIPVALVVFDLLWLDGHDTTELTLEERRELLELVVEQDHRLQVVTHVDGEGKAFVARRAGARPRGRGRQATRARRTCPGGAHPTGARSSSRNTQDCVILGWTPGQGGRAGSFGALLVGALDDGELDLDRAGRHGVHRQRRSTSSARRSQPLERDDPADRRSRARQP